jgi:hypothetical protein
MKHAGNQGGRPKGLPKTGGRRRGVKNKRTLAKEAAATSALGKRAEIKLAVDWLRDTAMLAAQIVEATRPVDEKGNERKGGNAEECLKWAKFLHGVAADLAQYESPKLSAVAIAPPPRTECTTMTVSIFDQKGELLNKIVDGTPARAIEGQVHEREE